MEYSAFFFDFDGVLADSVEVKTRAFAKLFAPYGPEIVAKVVAHHRSHGGMTRKDKFRHYYREFLKKPLDDKELQRLCRRFSSLVVDDVVSSPEIPGAEEFLKRWYKKLPCFVVSASPDEEILKIISQRGLKIYFWEVLGSSRSKQENLETLLIKHNLQPKKCWFFGDAESDYQVAKACNVNFMAIVPGSNAPLLQVAPEVKWTRDFIDLNIGE